jgi:hypothetical protein
MRRGNAPRDGRTRDERLCHFKGVETLFGRLGTAEAQTPCP